MKRLTFLIVCATLFFISCSTTKNIVDPYLGTWNYVIANVPTMGDLKGAFTITKEGNKYIGSISDENGQSTPMGNLMIQDGTLTSEYSAGGYDVDMKGMFENAGFTGKITVAGFDLDVTASKQ